MQNNTVLAVIAWLALIITCFTLVGYLRDKKHAATSGVIRARPAAQQIAVMIGGSRLLLDPNGVLFGDGPDALLTIRLVGGKLLVSTQIRNPKGELIAEMKDNEWNHQQRPAIFDRNYTDNALEIRDSTGKVVLQVVDLGQSMYFAGAFQCKNGNTITVGPDPVGGGAVLARRAPGFQPDYFIEPICDYPSDTKLGSCPGIASIKIPEGSGGSPIHSPIYPCG